MCVSVALQDASAAGWYSRQDDEIKFLVQSLLALIFVLQSLVSPLLVVAACHEKVPGVVVGLDEAGTQLVEVEFCLCFCRVREGKGVLSCWR